MTRLDIGDVLRTSVWTVRQRPGALLGLQALGLVPGILLLVAALMVWFAALSERTAAQPAPEMFDGLGPFLVGYALSFVVMIACQSVAQPAAQYVALDAFAGGQMTSGEALAKSIRRAPAMLAATGLGFLAYLVFAMPIGLVAEFLGRSFPDLQVLVVVVLGGVGLILAGFVGVSLSLFVPAVAAEELGVFAAIRRSWELMSGNRAVMFAVFLAIGAAYFVVSIPVSCCLIVPLSGLIAVAGPSAAGLFYVALIPLILAVYAWVFAAISTAYVRTTGWGSAKAADQVAEVFR